MRHLSVTEDTGNTTTKQHNGSHLRSSELRPAKVFERGQMACVDPFLAQLFQTIRKGHRHSVSYEKRNEATY